VVTPSRQEDEVVLAAVVAAATIVQQHGMAGVELGMTGKAVVAKLGKPAKITHGNGPQGAYTSFCYRGLELTFAFNAGLSQILTRSRTERTSRGVGVGSTRNDLATKIRGVRCVTESGYEHCYVGRWSGGQIITDFSIANGRVTRVVVGRILD
jgi:hypothetical protein